MLRICMICQSYYLRDPRVRREAEALAESGFNVDIITLCDNGEPSKEKVSGVNIFRLPLMRKRGGISRYLFEYLWFFLLSSSFLLYLHIKQRYDLIQIHTMPDFLVFSSFIPKILGAKVVLDVHEPMPELFISKYNLTKNNFLIKLLLIQERLSFRFPNHIFTVHEPLRKLFIEKKRIKKNKIDVILNLSDTKIFKNAQLKQTAKLGNQFVLVYTGTIAERYGLDIAIKGIKLLKNKIPGLKLCIIGEGEDLPYLKNLTTRLNLESYIDFCKPVPLTQIPNFLIKANLGISPHRQDIFGDLYFSTKIVEFLTIGLPIVVARTKTIQYYFNDDRLLFFTPEDIDDFAKQVLRVYENPILSKKMVENAKKYIEKSLNWDVEKKKYIRLVKNIINKGYPKS